MIEPGEDSGAALGQLPVPPPSGDPWEKLSDLHSERGASKLTGAVWPTSNGSARGGDAEGARWTWIHLERSLASIESRIEHQTTALLLAARDDERRRLARDLHDGLQQDLVVLRMRLGLLSERGDVDPSLVEVWNELARDVDKMIGRLRDLSNAVFPPVLIDRGLTAALRSYLVQVPLSVEFLSYPDPLPRLSSETEASIYFLVLEAITNALKHAGAFHLEISVRLSSDGLEVRVGDDGRGFELSYERGGRGLKNMAERVEGLGGYLKLSSERDVGTEVYAFIPMGGQMGSPAPDGHGVRPSPSPRLNGDRPRGDRLKGKRTDGERSNGSRPRGDRLKGKRTDGERSNGSRPRGDLPPRSQTLRANRDRWKEAFARFEQELEASRTNGDPPEKSRSLRPNPDRWKEAFSRFEQELEASGTNGDHPDGDQVR